MMTKQLTEQKAFHITIATGLGNNDLQPEVRLLKSALLYADRVKLCSISYALFTPVLALIRENPKEHADFVQHLIPLSVSSKQELTSETKKVNANVRAYKTGKKNRRYRTKDELLRQMRFQQRNAVFIQQFTKDLDVQTLKTDIEQIADADKAGLLDIYYFDILSRYKSEKPTEEDANASWIAAFLSALFKTVEDNSTYPLFDDHSGELVKVAVEHEIVTPSTTRVSQVRHSALAAEFLSHLPLFENASVKEIIDIRRELERPLTRFRSAIIKYSEKVKTASWDKDFSIEAEDVLRRDIQPAILDIEDAVKSSSSLIELSTRKLADKPAVSTSVLTFIVSQLSNLPVLSTAAVAAGVGGVTAVYDAYKEWQKQEQILKQNHLFFYYRAGDLLTEQKYKYRK